MWIVRELTRLAARIAVAVLIAIVIAEVRALLDGGDTFHTFRVVLMLVGGLFLLLAAGGSGSVASHRVNWGEITPGAGGVIFRGFRPRPEDPTLTPSAVFIGSGLVLLALGVLL
jgi:hypothetical protein